MASLSFTRFILGELAGGLFDNRIEPGFRSVTIMFPNDEEFNVRKRDMILLS